MTGFESLFFGVFGLIYLGIVVAVFIGFVMLIQALRRMANAQEESVRALNAISSHLASGGRTP